MRHAPMVALIPLLLATLASSEPVKEDAEKKVLALRIDEAIDAGVKWLKKAPDSQGTWGKIDAEKNYKGGAEFYQYPAGPTALALLTLLKCGVKPGDEVVARGFKYLRTYHRLPRSSYETSILILALEAKYNRFKRERKRERILRLGAKRGRKVDLTVKITGPDGVWMTDLVKHLLKKHNDRKGWRYGMGGDDARHLYGNKDISNTSFAILALTVAHRCKVKIPDSVFARTLAWVLTQQEEDGEPHPRFVPGKGADPKYAPPLDKARGWAYLKTSRDTQERAASGGMTAAALATIMACRKVLEEKRSKLYTRPLEGRSDRAILDGIAWLDRNWNVHDNPGLGLYYRNLYLYALERVGDLKRVNLIGSHDWFVEGATVLVDVQKKDGFWKDWTHLPQDVLGTCFALLFLDRATLAITGG